MTTGSCGGKGDTNKVGASFTVFETVRHDTKGKSLNLCLGLLGGASIRKDPRQVEDFCDSTTVFLSFNFDSKFHMK